MVGGQVKERLTGAIILVALIVLLVPELLSGPVRSATRAATPASSSEEPPLRSYTINLTDDAHGRAGAAAANGPQQPAPLAQSTAPAPDTAEPASAPAAPQEAGSAASVPTPAASVPPPLAPPPAAKNPPPAPPPSASIASPSAPAAGDAGGWMVQLGSFASRGNAEHLAQKVHAQGFAVSVSQGSSGRRLYRVRVGPARDRAAAAQLEQKLRASGHSGSIVAR
jgi:DedD protein